MRRFVPIIGSAARPSIAALSSHSRQEIEMDNIAMDNVVGNVARWGSNALLIGIAALTCVVFISA